MNFLSECLPPFRDLRDYPELGGYGKGRLCSPFPPGSNLTCCLPCPIQDYVYPDNFASKLKIAQYCSIPSLLACAFLLFSFVFLPPEKSQRHYLSVGLLISVLLITISFIIPLGTDPDLCYDQVTPHDMYSDMSCAWTGALLQVGGMGAVVWVLLRTAWLHIRICWDREPGLMFALFSMISGITIPAVFLASVLASSGVSYRTGQVCFANHDKSFAAYWAWLITFAGLSLVLQLITAVYCVYIFVRSQRREKARMRGGISSQTHRTAQEGGSQLRSGFERVRHSSVEWRKIRRLFLLQWRGIAISILVVIQTVYFATTFINQDSKLDIGRTSAQDMLNFQAWGTCLVFAGGNKNPCLNLAEKITGGPHIVISSVVWAGLSGVICFFFLARTSMFTAWLTLLTSPAHRLHEHLIARRAPKDEEHNPFSYASDKEAAKRISAAPSHASSPHRSATSRHRSRSSVISTKTTSSAKSNTSGGSASGAGGAGGGKSPKHSPSNSQHKTLSIISETSPSFPTSPTTAAALAAAAADKSLPSTPGTPATPRKTVPSKYRVPTRLNPVPRIVAMGPNAPTRVGLPKEVVVGGARGARGSREVGPMPERKASLRASEAFPGTAARLAAEEELEGMLGIGGEGEGERDGGEGDEGEKDKEKEKEGEQQGNGAPAPTSPPTTPPPSSPPPSSPPPSLPLPLEPPKQDIRHPSVLMPATAKAQLAAAVRAQVVRELAQPARSESPLWGRPEQREAALRNEALYSEAESSKAGQLKAEREEAQQLGTLMPDPRTVLLARGGLGMNPVVVETAKEGGGQRARRVEEEAKEAKEGEKQEDAQPSLSVPRKPVGGAAVAAQVEAIEKAEEKVKAEEKDEKDDEKEQKEGKREEKEEKEVAVGEPSAKFMALTPEAKKEADASKAAPQAQTQTLLRTPSQHGPNWSLQSGPKTGEEDEDKKDGTYFYAL
ncbi:hypothetical protein H2201_004992 [Coniosporium apollinis]|uniref:G-protein coupled receptors family 2 profile 2 domain-containing protein n=1 Tax=Coniosporium apollinis TaxID=61459 RepID=A0ABQ9NRB0_9PEZI|nr:hypothetical protein H2201_004992 [Coniosporium apollinis]